MKRVGVVCGLWLVLLPASPLALGAAPPHDGTAVMDRQADAAGGGLADDWSLYAVVTRGGRRVGFESYATNLVPEAGEEGRSGAAWGYVRDPFAGTTTLVTRTGPGTGDEPADGGVADITPDGRFALVNLELPGADDTQAFVRNLETGATELVSRGSGPSGPPAAEDAFGQSISNDGRRILFGTAARNVRPGDPSYAALLIRDRRSDRTTVVTPRRPVGARPLVTWRGGRLSGNGRYVTYALSVRRDNRSYSKKNTIKMVVSDTGSGKIRTIAFWPAIEGQNTDALEYGHPTISRTGRYVAYGGPTLRHGERHPGVLRWDRRTGHSEVVSRGGDYFWSGLPAISDSGRFVAFTGYAAEPNVNVWLRDLRADRTRLVSRPNGGGRGNLPSAYPDISADGRYVAFQSAATNLTPGVRGNVHIYLRHMAP
jgi:hypothetical protein